MAHPLHPPIPHYGTGAGVATVHGTVLPTGFGQVFYVGTQRHTLREVEARRFNTLSAALNRCMANRGDVVLVLPGHAENVADTTMLTDLKAGVTIARAAGAGAIPTFTFTAAGASWLVDDAGCHFDGIRFDFTGAGAAITRGIYVTAADTVFRNCQFSVATGATTKATIVLEATAAAHRLSVVNCFAWGTATQNVTNGFLISGAADGVSFERNRFLFSATAANGCINFTAAATNITLADNVVFNTHTASTAAINVANVAATGVTVGNRCATINDGTANAQGLVFGAAALLRCFDDLSSDEPRRSGVAVPAAVAT